MFSKKPTSRIIFLVVSMIGFISLFLLLADTAPQVRGENTGLNGVTITLGTIPTAVSGTQALTATTSAAVDYVTFQIWNSPEEKSYIANNPAPLMYTYNWLTTAVPNGQYYVKAIAWMAGVPFESNVALVNVSKPTTLTINFYPTPPTTLSGTNVIYAITNVAPTTCEFQVVGQKNKTWPAESLSALHYKFTWNTVEFPNDAYTLKVRTTLGDQVAEATAAIIVSNTAFAIVWQYLPTAASGTITLNAVANLLPDNCHFELSGPQKATIPGTVTTSYGCAADLITTSYLNGDYLVTVKANRGNEIASDEINLTIKNLSAIEPFTIKLANLPSVATGTINLIAQVNAKPDSCYFSLAGLQPATFTTTLSPNNTCSSSLNTTSYPNGFYYIKAIAKRGTEQVSAQAYLQISNPQTAPTTLTIDFVSPPVTVTGTATLKAKANQDGATVSFHLEGDRTNVYPGTNETNMTYGFIWPTNDYPNGLYRVRVYAQKNNLFAEKTVQINVSNSVVTAEKMQVNWISPPATATGTITLKIETNLAPINCIFNIQGPRSEIYVGKITALTCEAPWRTTDFPTGNYAIKATAKTSTLSGSDVTSILVSNPTVVNESPVTVEFLNPASTIVGTISWRLKTSGPVDEVQFYLSGAELGAFPGVLVEPQLYLFTWASATFPNGQYQLTAIARKGDAKYSTVIPVIVKNPVTPVTIRPPTDTTKPTIVTATPTATPLTAAETTKPPTVAATPIALLPARQAKPLAPTGNATTPSPATPTIQPTLPWECVEAKITEPAACQNYLVKLTLPLACRQTDILTKEACDIFLISQKMPDSCREADITNSAECYEYLTYQFKTHPLCRNLGPAECVTKIDELLIVGSLFTPQSDLLAMRRGELAPVCRQNNIIDLPACLDYLNQKYLPDECREAGITSKNECRNWMQEQYGRPGECQGLTDEECAGAIQNIKPLTLKYLAARTEIPLVCREARLTSFSQCETLLRKRELPRLCREQGYDTKKDCARYMLETFGRPADCQNKNNDQCQAFIYEIILADLINVETQTQVVTELKKLEHQQLTLQMTTQTDTTPSAMEILTSTPTTAATPIPASATAILKNFLPLKPGATAINMTLHPMKSANLKTSSLSNAIIFDADSDGLTDETETRLGTDPNQADTDGDGFPDGLEIANGYNPLGAGKKDEPLKPVEQALVNNQPLEEPKDNNLTDSAALQITTVEQEERLTVGATNTVDYTIISGQGPAASVVTLFIYSQLPIVVTVAIDEFGNWVYELDKNLTDGAHESYVVLHDEAGDIAAKSSPFAFFVREAKAITEDDYIAEQAAKITPTEKLANEIDWDALSQQVTPAGDGADSLLSLTKWYIIAGASVVILGLFLFILHNRLNRRHA